MDIIKKFQRAGTTEKIMYGLGLGVGIYALYKLYKYFSAKKVESYTNLAGNSIDHIGMIDHGAVRGEMITHPEGSYTPPHFADVDGMDDDFVLPEADMPPRENFTNNVGGCHSRASSINVDVATNVSRFNIPAAGVLSMIGKKNRSHDLRSLIVGDIPITDHNIPIVTKSRFGIDAQNRNGVLTPEGEYRYRSFIGAGYRNTPQCTVGSGYGGRSEVHMGGGC